MPPFVVENSSFHFPGIRKSFGSVLSKTKNLLFNAFQPGLHSSFTSASISSVKPTHIESVSKIFVFVCSVHYALPE